MSYDSRADTLQHIRRVNELLSQFREELGVRGREHDRSKLREPEKPLFDEMTPKLRGLTYGSEEYKEALEKLKPALEHHYEHNPHHPEHHFRGIYNMTLMDVVEMFCDWKAASERHDDGDIYNSIEHNKRRFNMSKQLYEIFKNTADEIQDW